MNPGDATREAPDDPHLPPLHQAGDLIGPRAPQRIAAAGLSEGGLTDLAAKLAFRATRLTTDWAAKQLRLTLSLAGDVMDQLCREGLAEETLRINEARAHYRITERGREHAIRSLEVCGYIGPAPVRLDAYAAMLRWQFANTPPVKPKNVLDALSGLVLSHEAVQLAGLAVSSGRSLFVYGPPGNGKSSIGRQIHAALVGDYWIPYCISVGNDIIRLFDEQVHQRVDLPPEQRRGMDPRWVRVRRPLVVVGGELTLDMLDLVYSPVLRFYEAPPHLKANGGVFLVDDFGRERVSPTQLLNRFITPMEYQIDYFTLTTGQKIQVPLRHVLIIATNLDPKTVTDPAFLRRMGYRLHLGPPTPEQYARIFRAYAQRLGMDVAPDVIDRLLARYRAEDRELRSCEPRDLIERARDACRFADQPFELTPKVLDLAWVGYFGSETAGRREPAEAGQGDGEDTQAEPQSEKGTS
jgi:predicted ATPase with chaperone activity